MTKQTLTSRNPDILASIKALRRAARRALELGLNTGTPVYVMKNGEIVDLTREMNGSAYGAAPMAVKESAVSYRIRKTRGGK